MACAVSHRGDGDPRGLVVPATRAARRGQPAVGLSAVGGELAAAGRLRHRRHRRRVRRLRPQDRGRDVVRRAVVLALALLGALLVVPSVHAAPSPASLTKHTLPAGPDGIYPSRDYYVYVPAKVAPTRKRA